MKQRSQSIDILRGVSIFIIIWAHLCLGWLLDEFVNITVLGIFFCISGYFYKPLSLYGTIRRKSESLLKPWLIFTAIGYIYHLLISMLIDHVPFRWWMIFTDLIEGCDFEANIPCWFFISMFEVFIFYSLLQKFSLLSRTVISIISFFIGITMLAHDINYLYLGKTALYLAFFHAGILIKSAPTLYNSRSILYNLLLVSVIVCLIYVKVEFISNPYIDGIVGFIAGILIFIFMLQADGSIAGYSANPLFKFVSYVGKNSLVVFALHILTNSIVWRLLYPYFHTPNMAETLLYAFLSLLLCLPAIPIYNALFATKKSLPSLKTHGQ